jgi:hypothetical protein
VYAEDTESSLVCQEDFAAGLSDRDKMEIKKGAPELRDLLKKILRKGWDYSRYKNIWNDRPLWNVHDGVLVLLFFKLRLTIQFFKRQ